MTIAEIEFLPEIVGEVNALDRDVKRVIVRIIQELKDNPHLGELMGDKWPNDLKGSRKIRFDLEDWSDRPRYRLVYRNEPEDGSVATVVVLAVATRDQMVAYARASSRLKSRIAEGGFS